MKLSSPAAQRNREPIAAVLADWLSGSGLILEVASGSGEHAVHFAQAFPHIEWQPSDPDPQALLSIEAWRTDSGLANLREPVILDASAETWPVDAAEAVLNINMVHISPWAAALGLLDGAARVLAPGGRLVVTDYGRPRSPVGYIASVPMRFDFHEYVRPQLRGELEDIIASAGIGEPELVASFLGYINVLRIVKP